jgi:hypothetical protein
MRVMNGTSGYPPAPFGPASQGQFAAAAPNAYAQPAPAAYAQPAPNGYGPPPAQNGYGAPPPQPASPYGAAPPVHGPPPGGYGAAPTWGPSPSYAPPAAFGYQAPGRVAYAESATGNGAPILRWFVLGSFLGMFVCGGLSALLMSVSEGGDAAQDIGGLFSLLIAPLALTYFGTVLAWIYKSWEMLPMSHRVLNNGTMVTPGAAIGRLFIPFYNLYWYFAGATGLCNAYNRALAGMGSPKRASTGLAITAAVFQVIPYVNIAIAPFFWVAVVLNVESAKREYARLSGITQ